MTGAGRDRRQTGVLAGRVGRAHGLDGSFYVTAPRPRLLRLGAKVAVEQARQDGSETSGIAGRAENTAIAGRAETIEIVRRAGTDKRPIVRLAGVEDRAAAEALHGLCLTVALADLPELPDGEFWAHELEGCRVIDGERPVGVVAGLIELPSCEALEVSRQDAGPLLVPMVRDAIRKIDVQAGTIDVDMSFLEET